MPRPSLATPEQLASLEGRQFIVLRPTGMVMSNYETVQSSARALLPESATYPGTGHVTLRGFSEPDRVEQLKSSVRRWAAGQPPNDLRLESIDSFPAPFKILICRLERTSSLVSAYRELSAMLRQTDFERVDERGLDDWVCHMSIAYCVGLSDDEWNTATVSLEHEFAPRPHCLSAELELVWFQQGVEYREVIELARSQEASRLHR